MVVAAIAIVVIYKIDGRGCCGKVVPRGVFARRVVHRICDDGVVREGVRLETRAQTSQGRTVIGAVGRAAAGSVSGAEPAFTMLFVNAKLFIARLTVVSSPEFSKIFGWDAVKRG